MNTYKAKTHQDLKKDVLIPLIESKEKWQKNKLLKELKISDVELFFSDLKENSGDAQILYKEGRRFIFVNAGIKTDIISLNKLFRGFAKNNAQLLNNLGGLILPQDETSHHELLHAVVSGMVSGNYNIGLYKSKKSEDGLKLPSKLGVFSEQLSENKIQAISGRAEIIAESQSRVRDLVNTAGNKKTPQSLAKWAEESAKKYNYEAEIYDLARIKKEGMLAIEAVNRGSESPAVFIILRYRPKKAAKSPKVGLIGKGVTYDTGGLSIKPSESMQFMKSDMAGAAAVLGTVEAIARMQLPVEITAAIPVTDNLVDALAIKPGDVIGSYSGKTIEVLNTDAEGRLILADALSWMVKNENPDTMIDLATLTGAAVRSLGFHAAALMGSDEKLLDSLIDAGKQSGERVWPFPLWDEYLEDLKSDVADLQNIGTKPIAGQITAAKFLEQFTSQHKSWAHLDIAGVAFGDTEFGRSKNATGWGVSLLVTYLENITA